MCNFGSTETCRTVFVVEELHEYACRTDADCENSSDSVDCQMRLILVVRFFSQRVGQSMSWMSMQEAAHQLFL